MLLLTVLTLPSKESTQYPRYPKMKLLVLCLLGKPFKIQTVQEKLWMLLQILGEQPHEADTNQFLDNSLFMLHYGMPIPLNIVMSFMHGMYINSYLYVGLCVAHSALSSIVKIKSYAKLSEHPFIYSFLKDI